MLALDALADDSEWLDLIAKLRERKGALVRAFIATFDGTVVYEGKVPKLEIDSLVASTMEMYLLLLAGLPLPEHLERLPAELGARRARQGVPFEQLLEGVRSNSRVLWHALRELAVPDHDACLVRNTEALLNLVEWHLGEVQRSYLGEIDRLARHSESHRRRAISRLFEEGAADGEQLREACEDLRIASDQPLELLVQAENHAPDCPVCAHSADALVHEFGRYVCHFRIRGDLAPQLHVNARGVRAFFDSVPNAYRLREATVTGRTLLTLHGKASSTAELTPAKSWPLVAWRALSTQFPTGLLPIDVEAFSSLPVGQRERLIETVRSYAATGSIKATSAELYCHRNTIVKRLAQVEEALGLRFSVPAELALIVIYFETLAA